MALIALGQRHLGKVEIHEVDVIPRPTFFWEPQRCQQCETAGTARQFSLVVGLSDLATNFLQIDQQAWAVKVLSSGSSTCHAGGQC